MDIRDYSRHKLLSGYRPFQIFVRFKILLLGEDKCLITSSLDYNLLICS